MSRRPSFARYFLAALALSTCISVLWSLATPLNAAPDERSHLIRAAAVVRGQILSPAVKGRPAAYTGPRVPEVYENIGGISDCAQGRPAVPDGGCPHFPASSRTVVAADYVGHYPPLYYLLTGLPTYLDSRSSIYLVRGLSAFVNGVFLALAVAAAGRWSRSRLLVPALAVAVTPQVVFLTGVINPSGLEICAAIAMWTSALILVCEYPESAPRGLIGILTASACIELLVRGDSFLWIALCAVAMLPMAWGRLDLRAHLGARDVQAGAMLASAAGVVAAVWLVVGRPNIVVPLAVPPAGASELDLAREITGQADNVYHQAIGWFGWIDTPAPPLTFWIWSLLILGSVLLPLTGRRRLALTGLLTTFLAVAVPFVLLLATIRSDGALFQARYFLALAVAVPLVAGAGAPEYCRLSAAWQLRIGRTVLWLVAAAQIASAWWALRRYLVGSDGPILPTSHVPNGWVPPLPGWLLDSAFILAWIAVAGAGSHLLNRGRRELDHELDAQARVV